MVNCIATAASYNHGVSLLGLLKSLRGAPLHVLVTDLGLGSDTKRAIESMHNGTNITMRSFDFAGYPPHFNIAVARGEYAWKPFIIMKSFEGDPGCDAVLWLDAGDRATPGSMERVFKYLHNTTHGFISTRTSGTVGDWVHSGMRGKLASRGFETNLTNPMCNGAIVGIVANHPRHPIKRVLIPWTTCAVDKDCIAPPGSSRKNHRQDQAALTVIAHSTGFGDVCSISEGSWTPMGMVPGPLGIEIHQDEGVRDTQLKGTGLCGCYYDLDQRRSVALRDMPLCSTSRCGGEPLYYSSASMLAGNPKLTAFGRQKPVVSLFAEKGGGSGRSLGIAMATYASAAAMKATLPMLFRTVFNDFELVIVVDRVTTAVDDSLDVVREAVDTHFRKSACHRVQLVDQPTPIFETSANNIAMRMINPSFAYVLIQPDMLFQERWWDKTMLRSMRHDAELFAISARCAHDLDETRKIGRCGLDVGDKLGPSQLYNRKLEYRQTANRGPLMLHAATTKRLGFLDERHFVLGGDEHDLIKRASMQKKQGPGWLDSIKNVFKGTYGKPTTQRPLRTRAAYLPIAFHAPLEYSSSRNPVPRSTLEAAYLARRRGQ